MTPELIKRVRTWVGHTQAKAAEIAGFSSQGAWSDAESRRRAMNPANWEKYTRAVTPTLLLIRGIPGSGKSTIARALVDAGQADVHLESDAWLYDDAGEYKYSPERVKIAHAECIAACRTAMRSGKRVAVANTFIKHWQIEPYRQIVADLQAESGLVIPFQIILAGGCWQSVHNVPDDALQMMRDGWED